MKAKVTNNSKAIQGVWTEDGIVHIEPGHSRTLTIKEGHEEATCRLAFLHVAPVGESQSEAVSEPAGLDTMTDDELRAMVEKKIGKKPHHKTGRAKLIEALA